MFLTAEQLFQERLKRWTRYLVLAVLLIAILVLAGWIFDIKHLIHPLPKLPAMNPTTAVVFIFFAISFFLTTAKNKSKRSQKTGQVFAIIVSLIGAVKLSNLIFGSDSKIDAFLFPDKILAETTNSFYGRMSPVAAMCFLLAGFSLLLLNFETRNKRMPAQYMALIIGFFGLSSFVGYIFTVIAFFGIFTYVTMAIHTAISFIFISLAILFTTPDKGFMKELTNPFAGRIVALRLIPIAVLIPVILGLIRLYMHLHGIVTDELGLTILIMSIIVSLLGFIYYTTKMLNKRDYESKESEDELTETNYFLNTILENIPNMIFVKDAKELRFFRFNKAGEELLGYSRNDLIGKNDYDFFPKEQADFFITKDRDVINSDSLMDIAEEPIMTKNGERWLHTKKIPVRNENGIPLYLVGISEDITERRKVDGQIKQLNAELEKKIGEKIASEQMFSSLFYKSPVMKAITEIETGRYLEVNDELADYLDYDKEEMRGKTSVELNTIVHPERREEVLNKLREDGFVRDVEVQIISRNGKISWASSSTDIISLNGKDCYLTATVDITERKLAEEKLLTLSHELEQKVLERTEELAKSEERFRKLLENNYEIISLSDENFIPFYRNPSSDKTIGWNIEESAKAEGGMGHLHPDDTEHVKKTMKDVLASSGKAVPIGFRTRHKAGHYIRLEGFMTNLLHDESLKGIITNLRDVTERKKAEDEINNLTEELRQLLEHIQTSREEERKYLAREIHDELGQRLTALKIDVSMMRRKVPATGNQGYISDELNSVIGQIDQSIQSVKRIATDLRPEILDHHGIIAAVKWQAEKFEKITGVKCKVSYLPDDMNLESDLSTAVYRMVQEALTNIVRHAQATAVSILIELYAEKLLVEIKDNGVGIREDQINNTKSLGLIGIRERVHLLNGTLFIKGMPGKGTIISASIPLKRK